MTSKKLDELGYCVYVRKDELNVLKMRTVDFLISGFSSVWIKKLIGGNIDDLTIDDSIHVERFSYQFSDSAINIFAEAYSSSRDLPLMVKTQTGGSILGNVVILGSDSKGETTLLTEEQGQLAINELGFYNNYKGINFIDAETNENKYLTTEQHPKSLKNLLTLLIDYCINEEIQLLTRAQDPDDNKSDMALVMCLHGDPRFIRKTHKVLSDFLKSQDREVNK